MKVVAAYDFDHTLSIDYMIGAFLEARGHTSDYFVQAMLQRNGGALPGSFNTLVANWIIEEVLRPESPFYRLTLDEFRASGEKVPLFAGLPEFFARTTKKAVELGIELGHYVVSSGHAEIVEGSVVAPHMNRIYGARLRQSNGHIDGIEATMCPEQKVTALVHITLGEHYSGTMDLYHLGRRPSGKREIESANVIYVGDGFSDIPAMEHVLRNGGRTIVVFNRDNPKKLAEARALSAEGYATYYVPADYRPNGPVERVMMRELTSMADRQA